MPVTSQSKYPASILFRLLIRSNGPFKVDKVARDLAQNTAFKIQILNKIHKKNVLNNFSFFDAGNLIESYFISLDMRVSRPHKRRNSDDKARQRHALHVLHEHAPNEPVPAGHMQIVQYIASCHRNAVLPRT